MVAKSFPGKQVITKHFQQNFLAEIFLWLQNHFHEKQIQTKNVQLNFLVENFWRGFIEHTVYKLHIIKFCIIGIVR